MRKTVTYESQPINLQGFFNFLNFQLIQVLYTTFGILVKGNDFAKCYK